MLLNWVENVRTLAESLNSRHKHVIDIRERNKTSSSGLVNGLLLILIEIREEDSASTATTLRTTDLGSSQVVTAEELSKRHLRINLISLKFITNSIHIKNQRFLKFRHSKNLNKI